MVHEGGVFTGVSKESLISLFFSPFKINIKDKTYLAKGRHILVLIC